MSRDWQFSTVQEFLRQCNWQGKTLPKAPARNTPRQHTPRQHAPQSWQSQTVQDFLSHSNWNGKLQPVKAPKAANPTNPTQTVISSSVISSIALNATLPVNKFFNLFVWEAQPEIAAVPKLNAVDPPVDSSDLNLSDFSDLF
ncbi:Photosystem II assembly protein [Acaryochloris thomasi RCC1774]|uniref:Photosystem II assembly protein n=1 Tax=Acaryochloris thomasi RCC1774 TaxID=1764569 RepID=A0A2W1JQD6_9CYAN|nr:hypothetical protein [Acaryochloris thomasi]PZD73625.1 Photosystem II assembly protein [Acaryochloris thomasi RCC1774]